jgi:hypothetical protein
MFMRGLLCIGAVLALGAMLTACAGIGPVHVPTGTTSTCLNAPGTAQAASGTAAADTRVLGILPVPAGAQPWHTNASTDKLMYVDAFVRTFYIKSAWTEEESVLPRRGFVSGVIEGWDNPDGTQQAIAISCFATVNGAQSQFDGLAGRFRDQPAPATLLTDPADGGVGTVSPTLDSRGNAIAEIAARAGDYVVDVLEYSAAAPDPAAAKALLLKQYDSIKRG